MLTNLRIALLGVLVGLAICWQADNVVSFHDGSGAHIDEISIDVGPPGTAQGVTDNGRAAVGDRNGDGLGDPEGYDTSNQGDAPGVCGNGIDDDLADSDADTLPDTPDGSPDDGCQVTLTAREKCINMIDDGILNADEDAVVAGQDRASIDITIGSPTGGGVPPSRPMSAWQFALHWGPDVIDVDIRNVNFLILANGGSAPFTIGGDSLPKTASPFTAAISAAGPGETGSGVLARVTIEAKEAGVASLTLADVAVRDQNNMSIPVNRLNGATVAVSKDGTDDGTVIGDSAGELFHLDTCPGPNGIAIDMDPTGNGLAAGGDRDSDGLSDAEGAPPAPSGTCTDNTDDDNDGGATVSPDGMINDGCVVPLGPLNRCAEIIDDGALNADEDEVDSVYADVLVGSQSGPGGGVWPGMSAFQFALNWDSDVFDVTAKDSAFLIHSGGAAQPFSSLGSLPDPASPWTLAVTDAGPSESGAGVLARLTLEGNANGIATISLSDIEIRDAQDGLVPMPIVNKAFLIVSATTGGCTDPDGDDIPEAFDRCPGAFPSGAVDDRGCSYAQVDADGDWQCNPGAPSAGPAPGCAGSDNCPTTLNPGQEDFDLDGEGDTCDLEDDGDGFTDAAEASIGTGTLDPCGNNGWPAELAGNDNRLNIGDFNSFLVPLRDLNGNTMAGEAGPPPVGDDDGHGLFNKFGHLVPEPQDANIGRWNLLPDGVVNIGDLNALNPAVIASTSRPPMFGGQPAFFANAGNGVGGCPFPP